MKRVILTFILLITFQHIYSQNGKWDTYIAQWDEGPGSVTLNMDLINSSPNKSLPFLIVTGVKYKKCRNDGFPEKEEFDLLYEISDSIFNSIKKNTKSELVGTFTFQCERLDYIYVRDTTNIRDELERLYSKRFNTTEYYINIKNDSDWKAYREFLYPNSETLEYMSNQKVIASLIKSGDNLSKPRKVDHWIYFSNEKDRENFVSEIKREKYKVESLDIIKRDKMPYQLHISRKDYVDLQSITLITQKLSSLANKFMGEYDGWETLVVR